MAINKDVIVGSAFAMGFFHCVGYNDNTFNLPLPTTIRGVIYGTVCGIGSLIPIALIPPVYLPVLPVICGTSIVYRKYNEVYHPERISDDTGFSIKINMK